MKVEKTEENLPCERPLGLKDEIEHVSTNTIFFLIQDVVLFKKLEVILFHHREMINI